MRPGGAIIAPLISYSASGEALAEDRGGGGKHIGSRILGVLLPG